MGHRVDVARIARVVGHRRRELDDVELPGVPRHRDLVAVGVEHALAHQPQVGIGGGEIGGVTAGRDHAALVDDRPRLARDQLDPRAPGVDDPAGPGVAGEDVVEGDADVEVAGAGLDAQLRHDARIEIAADVGLQLVGVGPRPARLVEAGEGVVVEAPGRHAVAGGRRAVAPHHVAAAAADLGRAGLGEQAGLPLGVGPLDAEVVGDHVVARAAHRRRRVGAAVEQVRARRAVGRGRHRVGEAPEHDVVIGEHDRIVVIVHDRLGLVAEVAGDAVVLARQRVEVEAVGGDAGPRRHRRVAADAERAQRPGGLALAAGQGRAEDRIVAGVGVRARRPLLVGVGVAAGAGDRI